jgi:hypothetical protein
MGGPLAWEATPRERAREARRDSLSYIVEQMTNEHQLREKLRKITAHSQRATSISKILM